MAIKTLLIAGVTTLGLCTGALAQFTSNGGQANNTGQGNVARQTALAFGGGQAQQATLIQGRALANIGVQLQNSVQNNLANNIAVQNNIAVPLNFNFGR